MRAIALMLLSVTIIVTSMSTRCLAASNENNNKTAIDYLKEGDEDGFREECFKQITRIFGTENSYITNAIWTAMNRSFGKIDYNNYKTGDTLKAVVTMFDELRTNGLISTRWQRLNVNRWANICSVLRGSGVEFGSKSFTDILYRSIRWLFNENTYASIIRLIAALS